MTTLTQTLKRRQAIVKYAKRYGVSNASYRYNVSRPTIYKWIGRYNGHLGSLKDESRRPHHHPNQHTEAELEGIRNMRRPDPSANPYLAFALMICAAMDGISQNLPIPPEANINFFEADDAVKAQYRQLPDSLAAARQAAEQSEFIRRHVPSAILSSYFGR